MLSSDVQILRYRVSDADSEVRKFQRQTSCESSREPLCIVSRPITLLEDETGPKERRTWRIPILRKGPPLAQSVRDGQGDAGLPRACRSVEPEDDLARRALIPVLDGVENVFLGSF